MPNNIINKVIYDGRTIIDLTDTTATADKIISGFGAYGANGVWMSGTASAVNNQNKSTNPSTSQIQLTADSGYTGLGTVTVNAIQIETKSATPTEAAQTITPTEGKFLTSVSVGAISNTYIGSSVARKSSSDLTVSGATVTAPAGYYASDASKSVAAGSVTAPSTITSTAATVSTGTNTLTLSKTVSVTPNVTTAGYISSGTAGNAAISLTATVTTKAAATITPSATNQTIASGTYLTGTQTIAGDADLIADNIKSGVQIFNVTGTYTSDATASAADILNGQTAFGSGRKIEGSLIVQKYYTGSSAPSAALGNNGDIYFQS